MDCDAFLDGYTAFRDGELSWAEREAFRAHLEGCASCERYDRVVNRGVGVFRDLPELSVSDDFGARLQQRLRREDAERARFAGAGSGAATVTFSLAGVVALAAALGGGGEEAPARLDPVAARAPLTAGVASSFTAQLVRAGVSMPELPYPAVVYRGPETVLVSLAAYEAPAADSAAR